MIDKRVDIFGEERGLLRTFCGRQPQREAAGRPVIERQPKMKRPCTGFLKIAVDVGQVDRQIRVGKLQKVLRQRC